MNESYQYPDSLTVNIYDIFRNATVCIKHNDTSDIARPENKLFEPDEASIMKGLQGQGFQILINPQMSEDAPLFARAFQVMETRGKNMMAVVQDILRGRGQEFQSVLMQAAVQQSQIHLASQENIDPLLMNSTYGFPTTRSPEELRQQHISGGFQTPSPPDSGHTAFKLEDDQMLVDQIRDSLESPPQISAPPKLVKLSKFFSRDKANTEDCRVEILDEGLAIKYLEQLTTHTTYVTRDVIKERHINGGRMTDFAHQTIATKIIEEMLPLTVIVLKIPFDSIKKMRLETDKPKSIYLMLKTRLVPANCCYMDFGTEKDVLEVWDAVLLGNEHVRVIEGDREKLVRLVEG